MSCKHCHTEHEHEEKHGHEHCHDHAECHDHGCGHCHDHGHEHGGEENRKPALIRIGVSAALLLMGLLVPMADWMKIAVFALSYLTVGWPVVTEAVKSILRLEMQRYAFISK